MDVAVSVSAVQWLCYTCEKEGDDASLSRLFLDLSQSLGAGRVAVLQVRGGREKRRRRQVGSCTGAEMKGTGKGRGARKWRVNAKYRAKKANDCTWLAPAHGGRAGRNGSLMAAQQSGYGNVAGAALSRPPGDVVLDWMRVHVAISRTNSAASSMT